jgi:hypothetical protein
VRHTPRRADQRLAPCEQNGGVVEYGNASGSGLGGIGSSIGGIGSSIGGLFGAFSSSVSHMASGAVDAAMHGSPLALLGGFVILVVVVFALRWAIR